MKVLHSVVDLGRGGLENLIKNIVLGQKLNGLEVEVLCLADGGYTADLLREEGIKVTVAGTRRLNVESITLLRSLIKESKPDIFHLHTMPPGVLGRIATIGMDIPYIYHIHTMISIAHKFKAYQKIIQRVLQYKKGITVAISKAVKDDLTGSAGMKDRNIQVLSGGVKDIELKSHSECRKKFDFDDNELVITCAAHLIKLKNQATLIRAIKNIDNAVLVLAGKGDEENNLRKLAEDLQISHRVRFLGFVDNMAELYAASDVAALASYPREGLSLSMIEALRAGLPAVVSNVGGLPEVVEDGYNGYVVEAKCHKGFEQAFLKLADTESRREKGKAGREKFVKNYELENYLEKIKKIYLKLLD